MLNYEVDMKKYKIIIEGTNLLININDIATKVGFFATRVVECSNKFSAENIAIKLISDELDKISLNNNDDPPSLFISEVCEVGMFDYIFKKPAGFTWYKDDISN